MAKQITVRNVSPELGRRLARMSQERGESLNAVVLRILEDAAGIDARRRALERYATWTAEDLAEFEESLGSQREIDEEAWK
jgi:hypothetical protein